MQATKRSAVPLRVHQLWDALQNSGSNPIDFERLATLSMNLHKIPRDEVRAEVTKAVEDGLVILEEKDGVETYKLPAHTLSEPGDHDWYCFQCHLGGPVVMCEDCPRVYHLECLPDDRKPQKDLFVCPACHLMSTKPSVETVKGKQLNVLIEYVCDRFLEWQIPFLDSAAGKVWAQATDRAAKEAWRFNLLIFTPIDLKTMVDKANGLKYVSLEEFQVDCQTLAHNVGVYFGTDQMKGNQLGAAFLRDALHDIHEIKLCHDCFRRSNEKDHPWWFCLPCSNPHDVVWAKQSGYPYWPAKIMRKNGNRYDVRYFGGNYERGIIDQKNIQPIETPISSLKVRRNAAWNDAYDELQKFLDIKEHPEHVNDLPATRGKGSKGKSSIGKRKSETPTPERSPKKSKSSAKASSPEKTTKPQTNGVSGSAKKVVSNKNASDSKSKTSSSGVGNPVLVSQANTKPRLSTQKESISENQMPNKVPKNLLTEGDMRILNHSVDEGDEFTGDASFSDAEENDLTEKVSEDAVSSSCNETKPTRNVYVQARFNGSLEALRERFMKHLEEVRLQHAEEMSRNKKKQWCYNCEREAIYHCCWNTAYCTLECQQQHWTREHKKMCRRKKLT